MAKPMPLLDDVLAAFVRPGLALSLDGDGGRAFVRILARAYAEHNERLRKFLSDNYGHVLKQFAAAFTSLLPSMGKEDLYWRLDIVAGALTYAMADFGVVKRRSDQSDRDRERAAAHLIQFAAAGMTEPGGRRTRTHG